MKVEISAGGVVYQQTGDKIEFLIGKHSGHHRWVLPKGWIEDGESREDAAVREVKEEVGVDVEIGDYLGDFFIYYTDDLGEPVRKTNHFYLMKYKSGDPLADHGWEMEDVMWVTEKEAIDNLTYPSEKEMVQKAVKIIRSS